MKKILVFTLLALVALSSCKKDKDDPTYSKSQLIGKWKQVTPAPAEGTIEYLNISDTEIEFVSETKTGSSSISYAYSFNGKVITSSFTFQGVSVGGTLTINELTSTKLVCTDDSEKKETKTYSKIEK